MPLTRGEIIGYDAHRMSYKFTMMNEANVIDCEISNVALSDLMNRQSKTVQIGDREAEFLKWRDMIEGIASVLFDAGGDQIQNIQIFAKHLPRR